MKLRFSTINKGHGKLYKKIASIVEQEKEVRSALIKHMQDAVAMHMQNWGFGEEEFNLIFVEPVERDGAVQGFGQDTYQIIGISGFGTPMVRGDNDDLVCRIWEWEYFDNDTLRECFYELEEALAIAHSSPDGQGDNY